MYLYTPFLYTVPDNVNGFVNFQPSMIVALFNIFMTIVYNFFLTSFICYKYYDKVGFTTRRVVLCGNAGYVAGFTTSHIVL